MDIQKKIEKQIKGKEKQLETIKKAKDGISKSEDKDMEEDDKFKNWVNPFYKRKWKPIRDTYAFAFATMHEVNVENEINELKKLLKPTTTSKS
mgnify:CR=1 FL=1